MTKELTKKNFYDALDPKLKEYLKKVKKRLEEEENRGNTVLKLK